LGEYVNGVRAGWYMTVFMVSMNGLMPVKGQGKRSPEKWTCFVCPGE
jgi:hypothetical protein